MNLLLSIFWQNVWKVSNGSLFMEMPDSCVCLPKKGSSCWMWGFSFPRPVNFPTTNLYRFGKLDGCKSHVSIQRFEWTKLSSTVNSHSDSRCHLQQIHLSLLCNYFVGWWEKVRRTVTGRQHMTSNGHFCDKLIRNCWQFKAALSTSLLTGAFGELRVLCKQESA